MYEPGSFDVCKNIVAPMITILDHLELDTEISDTSMKTVESDNYREMSRNDRNVNGMLVLMYKGVRFFCKDE